MGLQVKALYPNLEVFGIYMKGSAESNLVLCLTLRLTDWGKEKLCTHFHMHHWDIIEEMVTIT